MRTLALTVAYDGAGWAGMQLQRRAPTIQGALEVALAEVLRHEVRIAAAGRTDAGVHALGQVVSLRTDNPLPVERLPRVVNLLLPASVRVRRAVERPEGFHARRSATFRRYWYVLQTTRHADPLRGRFCWQLERALELPAMQAALPPLLGRHDFAAFCHGGETKGTVRTLHHARVTSRGSRIVVDVQADAFVHRMVRLLVSNLVLIGSGERPAAWLAELLRGRDRHPAGQGAPPHGLILMRVGYAPITNPSPGWEEAGEANDESILG
jgi:tRNA pseudouridine38-40 synthase